nr:retrovirus-related Pol polyprotein from transposon TNT 1-94 [Tanacetum cinerariifolium]
MLYDGNVIAKETNVISIVDSEVTLMLEEESQSKMLLKQTDPMVLEKKVNTKPINYVELNRLFKDFVDVNTTVNYVEMCNKCLKLEAEHIKQHNMVEKDEYNRLSKRFSKLEQHCISLKISMEKVLVITALKSDLRKIKRKDTIDNAVKMTNATTMAPGMYKLDPIILAPQVIRIFLWHLDPGCSKHMTEDRSQLTNVVYKFLGTVKFGNDQVAKIMSVASLVLVEEAPAPIELTGSPSSTLVDQDASSPSTYQITQQSQSYLIPLSVEDDSHDLEVAHMSNDLYFGISIPKIIFAESSSMDVIHAHVLSDTPNSEHSKNGQKTIQSFALVDRLEVVRIVLAFAAHMNMIVYQMDVKTAFLNGILREEVYAPHARYDLLSSFLLFQGFSKGTVDPTLFISKKGKDILLHIDIRYHFIKEQVENGVVELYFFKTEYQLADIFTEALCRERIKFLIDKLGMRNFTLETLKELADEAEE